MAQFGKDIDNVTANSSIKITDTEITETFTVITLYRFIKIMF
jgi:hypothetical protein